MYLYESHMGGLYTSDEPLDYDMLYCEECGDSDFEIGYFDDTDTEGVWNAIKPSDLACIGCDDRENDGACGNCGKLETWAYGQTDLLHAMRFIAENMDIERPEYVYLICLDKDSERIFANYRPAGYDFGAANAIPCSFCLKEELREKIALSLLPWTAEVVKAPEIISVSEHNGGTCVVYMCVVRKDPEEASDAAWRHEDGWYGWCPVTDYKPREWEEWLGAEIRKACADA